MFTPAGEAVSGVYSGSGMISSFLETGSCNPNALCTDLMDRHVFGRLQI